MTVEIYMTIITGLLSIVGFFLTRAFSSLDKKADKAEVEALKSEVGALRGIIADIKDNYLTKEDFLREQLKTEKKLDKIMDILMEMKGGKKNE